MRLCYQPDIGTAVGVMIVQNLTVMVQMVGMMSILTGRFAFVIIIVIIIIGIFFVYIKITVCHTADIIIKTLYTVKTVVLLFDQGEIIP